MKKISVFPPLLILTVCVLSFMPCVAAAAVVDSDDDGVNDYRESRDGTNPNNATSFNPLSKDLVAYYPFDGNANDESGYGNNGTTTSVTFSPNRFGVDSSAISFAQDPSYVTTKVGALPVGAQSRTISFWARPNTLPISPMPAAVSYGTTTSGGNAFGVGIGADATPYFWGHGVDIEVVGSNTVNQRQWVQLVASLDSSGTLSVFQDGQLVARKPNSNLNTKSAGLLVGRWRLQNFEGFTCQFDGAIDQLRVYSRAFSESEVAQLFYAEAFTTAERSFITSNPSLIGHYSQAQYNNNFRDGRTAGRTDVTSNPSAYKLFTAAQYNANFVDGRAAGRSDVTANPAAYKLVSRTNVPTLQLAVQRNSTFSFAVAGNWSRYAWSGNRPTSWTFNTNTGELRGSMVGTNERNLRLIPYNGSQAGPEIRISLKPVSVNP